MTQAGARLDDPTLVVLVDGSRVTGRLGEVAPDVRWIECGAANASENEVNAQRLGRPLTGKPQALDPLSLTMLRKRVDVTAGRWMVRLDVRVFTPSMTRRRPSTRFSPRRTVSVAGPPVRGSRSTSSQPSASSSETRKPSETPPYRASIGRPARGRETPVPVRESSSPFGLPPRPDWRSSTLRFTSPRSQPIEGRAEAPNGPDDRVGAAANPQVYSRRLMSRSMRRGRRGDSTRSVSAARAGTHYSPTTRRYWPSEPPTRAGENALSHSPSIDPTVRFWVDRRSTCGKPRNLTHVEGHPASTSRRPNGELPTECALVIGDVRPSIVTVPIDAPSTVLTNAAFAVRTIRRRDGAETRRLTWWQP